MAEVPIAIALALGLTLLFGFLIKRLVWQARAEPVDPEWIRAFSLTRYRPMQRLLDESEFRFLRMQSGYRPEIEQQLRSERRRLYRRYLRSMSRDFDRLYGALKLVMLYSEQDRPDLAANLVRVRAGFHWAVLCAETRLALHWLGVAPADMRGLLDHLEAVRLQLGGLAAGQLA